MGACLFPNWHGVVSSLHADFLRHPVAVSAGGPSLFPATTETPPCEKGEKEDGEQRCEYKANQTESPPGLTKSGSLEKLEKLEDYVERNAQNARMQRSTTRGASSMQCSASTMRGAGNVQHHASTMRGGGMYSAMLMIMTALQI